MTPSVRLGSLWIALASSCWGTWRLWLHGPDLDTAAQGAFALTVSGLVASIVALVQGGGFPKVSARLWAVLGLFALSEAANYALYFGALGAGDSATAAVTHYLAPVLVAVASPLLGQPVGRRTAFAIPVAFLATLVLAGSGDGTDGTTRAAMLGAASAIFYGLNIFLGKVLAAPFSPWALVGFHNLLAAPFVWALSSTPPWNASAEELGRATIGALFIGVGAASLYFAGLRQVTPARAGVLAYMEPLVAAGIGLAVFGEPATALRLGAMAVVLGVGVVVATDKH